MRIDLHTHSDRSDGTESPAALVRRANTEGIDVLALTDHDTTDGWAEAAHAAQDCGLVLVRGLEVSCRLATHGVHLLTYLPDPTYPPFATELEKVLAGRNSRLPATLGKLRDLGIDITAKDVRRVAGGTAATGRPHVADALVAKGVVRDRNEAFARYLGARGPAYVDRYAADLVKMLGIVTAAGGVSVLAHPWAGRHNHDALDQEGLAVLAEAGLVGLEVDHEDHDEATRAELRRVARELDLVVTGSSDHHGSGKPGHDLGCNTTAPEEYERLLALAAAAARASGRRPPNLV